VHSSASQTSEHPWITETLANGAAVLVSAHPFAGLRSPRSPKLLRELGWQRQPADTAACAAVLGLCFEI